MPTGARSGNGDVALHGAACEYRLVHREDRPRMGFRWIDGAPSGRRACILLDPAPQPRGRPRPRSAKLKPSWGMGGATVREIAAGTDLRERESLLGVMAARRQPGLTPGTGPVWLLLLLGQMSGSGR